MEEFANTPPPPYYAVIFTAKRTKEDKGYRQMAERMMELVAQQPGFLGVESASNQVGITVSYWKNLESIKQWKENSDHREAQRLGQETWYSAFKTRICKVEREYSMKS